MAVPTTRRAAIPPVGPTVLGRLLVHAVGLLVDHVAVPRQVGGWRFGPLVILSAADGAAATVVLAALAARAVDLATDEVVCRDGERLGHEITAALAEDGLDRLAATLSAARIVVVDRIDRVAGSEPQEALAHLLDVTTAAGVTWCVSLPRLPADGLGPRCATRLGAGLAVAAPSPVPAAAGAGPSPSIGRLIRASARHHDVPVGAIVGPARHRTITAARSLAMYLARRLTSLSLQAIGDACGGRDHTTVLHGVRVCMDRIGRDPAFAADVDRLMVELGGGTAERSSHTGRRRSGVGSVALGRSLASRRHGRRQRA